MKRLSLILTSVMALALSVSIYAEPIKIKGKVAGPDGQPVIGVFVTVSGDTSNGAISDIDGLYEITVDSNASLDFSCMGYESITEQVRGRSVIDVMLREDSQLLEEIVVVGYGTQKKANVTGSVSTIDFAKGVEGRPVLSTSAALAGMAPGMSVLQTSGQPGNESTTIRIRGVGSFTSGSSAPLVLVDGIEWSMDNVNPNDIESISVLKDAASTAIYGTRAANGVILITTKNGSESKARVSYSYKGIIQMPYNNLAWVSDYARYMELFNEGCDNAGTSHQFSQTNIDLWKAASLDPYGLNEHGVPNYVAYPNTDWFNEIFDNGYSQEHNVSISGGSKSIKYLVSLGYLDNQGVMNRFNLDSSSQKANFRTNLEADVTKWFTIGTKIYGQWMQVGTANVANGFKYLYMTTPGIYPGSENAWGRPANNDESPNVNNILGQMAGSDGTKRTWRVNGTVYAKIRPYKGISIESTFNYAPTFAENHTWSRENGYWDYVTDTRYSSSDLSKAVVNNSMSRNYRMSTDLLARYDGTFGDHTVGVIAGYSATSYRRWGWGVSKLGATDWTLHDGSTFETLNNASYTSLDGYGLRSYFGRVNYSYKDRYLFEANLRADGSSRFGTNTRFGIFPSFSAGWKIHEEEFMSAAKGWLSSLKLRASWGQTGNNLGIGNFAWQATYASKKVTIDGANATGLYIASMSNINLKWETTTTTDIGIDAGFFDNRLTADIDYYYKNTTDILFTPSTYLTMGNVSQVPSNLGSMWNQGIEIALNWKHSAGKDFYYWAGVNFSCNRNKVTSFKGQLVKEWQNGRYVNNLSDVSENWASPGKLCEGHAIGEHYMLSRYRGTGKGYTGGAVDVNAGPVDGMIRTEADMQWARAMIESGYTFQGVKNLSPDQLWYGDFIYADSNGDGNYGNEDDKNFNGHTSTPSYNLGINLGFSWKGLDFSMVWSGAFDYWIYWATGYYNASTVTWGYGISRKVADDHYFYNPSNPTDARTNVDGTYPRLYKGSDRNRETNDFYEYKGDYMKLKNVQIGYTVPEKWTKKCFVQQLRFYVSGENLLTITKFPGMDPELGSTIGYPLMRQVSVGAQITF
ncbi:MAG: TonB-dependent receptor [Bacteroidales bacterium]|nr:TonB-dependent receptor [Bacteroidales bacterium]